MTADSSITTFLRDHRVALGLRVAEHLELTAVTIAGAFILGITLAVIAFRYPRWRTPVLALTGMLQTVPGIALLVMAMALFHRIGTLPALSALLLYALLPIVQNTLVGLTSLPQALAEAAKGLGLSKWQRLRYIRLPLAMPMVMAGVRTAAVQTVGLATLAAFVGAGGLGQFINRGLFLSDTRLILLGAIPAALMALMMHGLLILLQRAADPYRPRRSKRRWLAIAITAIAALAAFTIFQLYALHPNPAKNSVTIGSKNFTEQLIVAEMVAQQIEHNTHIPVIRRFGLGGSSVMHEALRDGTIDVAVEYTGTALAAILHLPTPGDPARVYSTVRDTYEQQFHLTWLLPLGFNNSYQLAVRAGDARLAGVQTISQLVSVAPQLDAAFDFEFAERADGYRGLAARYGLDFHRVVDMHPDLLYPTLLHRQTDVISSYATDGRLDQPGIRVLEDNRHFFPPYEAAIVVREDTLAKNPELKPVLAALSGRLNDARMRRLNAAVDAKELSVEQAASQALSAQ